MLRRSFQLTRRQVFVNSLKSTPRFFSTLSPPPESSSPPPPVQQQKHSFKAETGKILDIVSQSLYSERDVFLRELISNASDALEKFRFYSTTSQEMEDSRALEIKIDVDAEKKTLIISDSGIGMTKEEMIANLGTIGKSGSADFSKENVANKDIIGQFGVGFYSAFMVGNHLRVSSRSSKNSSADNGHVWESSGVEHFTLEPSAEPLPFGTRIEIALRDEEFATVDKVKETISRYSQFVAFPVVVNGERINTQPPLWYEEPTKVKADQYNEFFKFTYGGGFDPEPPMYTLHFRAEAPIDMKALLFVPSLNPEGSGMSRATPGVSLYTRKVLLEKEAKDILPNWARFVKGVVDSEDLPLSISRETAQDKRMVKKMGVTVTKKLLRFLRDKAGQDADKYQEFFTQFGAFIKEGVVSDFANQADLVKLLRFDTSVLNEKDKLKASLDDVVGRMPAHQKKLYFLTASNRKMALSSPYFESFKKHKIEVIFLYKTIDEFVMSNLSSYEGRDLVSLESNAIEKDLFKTENQTDETVKLENPDLCAWLKQILEIHSVEVTDRLEDFPAIVVDHESAAMRRMMKVVDQHEGFDFAEMERMQKLNKRKLEINLKHPLVQSLERLRTDDSQQDLAKHLAQVVYDGALMQADLMDDPRESLKRTNAVLQELLQVQNK